MFVHRMLGANASPVKNERTMAPETKLRTASQRVGWIVLAIIVAVGFYIVALSNNVYQGTSPANLATRLFGESAEHYGRPFGISLHIALRKIYSIVAFTIVGWTAQRALPPASQPRVRMTILVAGYSAAIEFGQWLEGSAEGMGWHTFDVICGGIGGYLAIIVDTFIGIGGSKGIL